MRSTENVQYVAFSPSYEQFLFWCEYRKVDPTTIIFATPEKLWEQMKGLKRYSLIFAEDWNQSQVYLLPTINHYIAESQAVYFTYADKPVVESGVIVRWNRGQQGIKRDKKPKMEKSVSITVRLPATLFAKIQEVTSQMSQSFPDSTTSTVLRYILENTDIHSLPIFQK